jgi:Ca-activated chloride channel homolog
VTFQIIFDEPVMLWFLFSIPLLFFTHLYFMHHARRQAIKFGNFATLERVTGKRLLTKNILLLVLRSLIIVCLVFAAAGTSIWHETQKTDNDVVIVVDTSASMTTEDMDGTRIEAAKNAAKGFVENVDKTASIGVVQFSGLAEVVVAPTTDREAVLAGIDSIKIKNVGGTDVAAGIVTGTNLLATARHGRVILLMTDGVSSVSLYDESPIPASIAYAQKHHVVIHTIGVGTQTTGIGFIPGLQSKAASFDEQNLQTIANGTGGQYTWARNSQQLANAYMSVIEEGSTAFVPLYLNFGFLFVALLLLFVEWGLLNTRYRILP